ncbi:uncharacterized protein [Diabrotica undecimpunctata]|uniref:uncharacterized protein n=1 Tax=Diabrotica undecimpunctata TaxID=50387 RepID=UPI003B63E1CA
MKVEFTRTITTTLAFHWHILLNRTTHLVGRLDRKYLPQHVTVKLKKGEFATSTSKDGISILKWRDKRIVYVLTTKDSALQIVEKTTRSGSNITKSKCIVDYNTEKSSIDLSDQMASYSTALRGIETLYQVV